MVVSRSHLTGRKNPWDEQEAQASPTPAVSEQSMRVGPDRHAEGQALWLSTVCFVIELSLLAHDVRFLGVCGEN